MEAAAEVDLEEAAAAQADHPVLPAQAVRPRWNAPPNGQVGSANFYVDPDTHTVFLTADDATASYVSNVMANLNQPKPQVLIKVIFLQVTYNNGYDVGLEGGITKRLNTSKHSQRLQPVWPGPAGDHPDVRREHAARRGSLYHCGQ